MEERPSSSGSMVVHYDAPVIIYPPARTEQRHAGPRNEANTVVHGHKRKAEEGDAPTSPCQNTQALIVLYAEKSLAMSTDFAAFHYEFETRGIQAEYFSLISLEDHITRHGPLIYEREDIEGREHVTVLSAKHSKFYEVVPKPKEMKKRTLEWLTKAVQNAKSMDNIVFIIISHGIAGGSVIIGGEANPGDVDYLTIAEVKKAVANVPTGAYFTLINTACYSGNWINIVNDGAGNRLVQTASSAKETASNFRTASNKLRGGTFVCALLACLKRNDDGQLSEFVADIQKEVIEYNTIATKARKHKVEETPVAEVSRQMLWRREPQAFIPLDQATLQQRVIDILESIKSPKINELFKYIPSTKKRHVPDELIPEVEEMIQNAEARGFPHGEDSIYDSGIQILQGDDETIQDALIDTVIWRDTCWLQARHMLLILAAENWIDTSWIQSPYDIGTSKLSDLGWKYYETIEESSLIRRWRMPPAECIGGIFEEPLFWICNVLAEISRIDIYNAKGVVEDILACILSN